MSDVTGADRDDDGWVTEAELRRLAAAGVIRPVRGFVAGKLPRIAIHTEHRAAVLAEHRHGCPECALPPDWVPVAGGVQTELQLTNKTETTT